MKFDFLYIFYLSIMVSIFIVDGVINTFGLIEIELRTEFNEGKAITSWVPSIMSGMVLCIG